METEKLIAELMAEIGAMDAESFAPHHAIDPEEQETVIGECTELERKLFAISKMYAKLRDQHKVEAKYHTAEEGCDKHSAAIEEYHAKHTIFQNMMWYAVESRLKTFGVQAKFGVRKGWQITKTPRDKNDFPPGLRGIISSLGGDE